MTVGIAMARTRLRQKVDRSIRGWAAQARPVVTETMSLQPPTEREVLAGHDETRQWIRGWRSVEGVEWEVRRWSNVGTQTVPVRVTFTDLEALLAFTGDSSRWQRLRTRFSHVRHTLDADQAASEDVLASALRQSGAAIESLTDEDFDRLIGVLTWLRDNSTTGTRIRSLPIRGVDGKWFERHRGLLTRLHRVRSGVAGFDFLPNPPLVTVRFLDPSLRPGGIAHAALPVTELAALHVRPRVVLVCENLETVLTLPEIDGVIALFGGGYRANEWLRKIAWIARARAIYWGDLDSHGFAILDGVRAALPETESVMMDTGTLLAHRDLWVSEPQPTRSSFTRLTDAETSTLELLRANEHPRLEQERIPWATALRELRRSLLA